MGIIGRQTIKSTIYIYLGVVIGFIVRAYLFPEYLSASEIGIVALLVSYGSIFSKVALLGFNQAAIKYFPYFRNKEEGHGGFLALYLIVIAIGFLLFIGVFKLAKVLLVGNSENLFFSQYYYLCIPLTAGLLIYTVMDSYNTVLYNASTGVLVRELVLRVLILISLVPLIYGIIGFNMFLVLYVGAFCIIGFLMIAFIAWRGELQFNLSFRKMEKTMIRAMAGISIFGFFTGLTNEAVLQVNNILVNEFYDEAQTGIYATNFFFATLILIPSRGLNKIAPTMISDAFKRRNLADIDRIQFKSTLNQLLIAMLIFIGLFINMANIYQILPPPYAIGGWVIILTGLANVVQMGGGVGSAIIAFSGFYRFNTYLSIMQLVLLIGLNLLLLPHLGITGAAMATLISAVLINLIKYLIIKAKFKIQPYSKKHLLILLIAVFCVGINELIPTQSNFLLDIIIRSLIVALAYILANYFLKTSAQLNDNLNKALRMLRIR